MIEYYIRKDKKNGDYAAVRDSSDYTMHDIRNKSIKSDYKGLPVKEISDKAFFCYDQIKSITLPKTIIKIGDQSFYGCELLRNINIPKKTKTIGEDAFGYCYSLKNIQLPALEIIGKTHLFAVQHYKQ